MDPMTIGLIAQGGIAAGQAIGGTIQKRRAQKEREAAIRDLEDTRYADYNQAYYNELQRRESVGLPEAQRQYMEQQAQRAAGVGLAATEDRRAGIMGIGRAQAGLAQSYTNIGMADVAAREQNAQRVLGEMGQRGMQTYQEQMQLGQLDLSLAEQGRQEGLGMQQAGMQGLMTTAGQAATFYGNQSLQEDLYDLKLRNDKAMEEERRKTAKQRTPQGTPNQFSNYTPPQNLSLSQNNSPFAYGAGLNSGYGSGLNQPFVPSGIY
jgi:hypothetical protein